MWTEAGWSPGDPDWSARMCECFSSGRGASVALSHGSPTKPYHKDPANAPQIKVALQMRQSQPRTFLPVRTYSTLPCVFKPVQPREKITVVVVFYLLPLCARMGRAIFWLLS